MPQVITTNIASLNSQRTLDLSSASLNTSLQRLASGLRINSAKDDAAGLAIATRFSSRISGLTVASRNANDAISLAQVAEGALQETTRILQRSRELAIQSANGSNSAADRRALQAEVNQLKSELNRVSTTTTFNGLDILNGELNNASFQIGSEANQTVNISINDTRTTAIGTNTVLSNNNNGIEQATHNLFLGGGTSSSDAGIGTDLGIRAEDSDDNGYASETLTVTYTNSSGSTATSSVTTSANDTAYEVAADLAAISGVDSAVGFNHITLSASLAGNATTDLTGASLYINDGAANSTITIALSDSCDYSDIASAINADTDLAASGIYAISTTSQVDIFATQGHDLDFHITGGAAGVGYDIASGLRTDVAATSIDTGAATCSATYGGRVDVKLAQGYALTSSSANYLGSASPSFTRLGLLDKSAGNIVDTQTVSISGSTGATTVSVAANDDASTIATKINQVTGTTNVKASARTEIRLQNLTSVTNGVSGDGTVTFDLYGDDGVNGSRISAPITTNDFTALIKAVNDQAGTTGVTAETDGANNVVKLVSSTGKDIKIQNFTHSAAQDYESAATGGDTIVTGSGSTAYSAPNAFYIEVIGNPSTNTGNAVRLYDGGAYNGSDSAVIGGQVTFSSSKSFSVSSNIDGSGYTGSLFGVAASAGNLSTLSSVNQVDISTSNGAQSAIDVLDEAINQISEVRADLGAIQSRFESAIRNLANNIENLNVARSRILDTDFAAETAILTKNQILTQAGVSILSQANSLPQNVLALLQ